MYSRVMFVFLSCPDTRGADRTLCLHLRCSPFSCLCSCIMKSLFTLWNLKRYKQSRAVSFLGTVPAGWEAKLKVGLPPIFFFVLRQFNHQCSQLFYPVLHLSFRPSHKKANLSIQTERCSDFISPPGSSQLPLMCFFPVQKQVRVVSFW